MRVVRTLKDEVVRTLKVACKAAAAAAAPTTAAAKVACLAAPTPPAH
jgi:hypothetical protein